MVSPVLALLGCVHKKVLPFAPDVKAGKALETCGLHE